MPGRKIRSEDEARRCLEQIDSLGVPRVQWAREHGIDARSLNAWRLNLQRREMKSAPAPALRVVELVPRHATPTPSSYRVLCGPFAVEVPPSFDDTTLARLLLAVVASC